MRNPFQGWQKRLTGKNRALFAAPVVGAFAILALSADNGAVIAAVWKDPQSVFAQRSPGERRGGELRDTKPVRIAPLLGRSGSGPTERVLGQTRQRPIAAGPTETSLIDGLPLPDARQAFLDAPALAPAPQFDNIVPAAFNGPGPNLIVPPGGNPDSPDTPGGPGDTGPGPDTPPTDQPPPPPVPPAVPEPATWLMNIIGMFAIASVLRRRKSAAATAHRAVACSA